MLVGWLNQWAWTLTSMNTLHVQNTSQYFHSLPLLYFSQQPNMSKHKWSPFCAEKTSAPCSQVSCTKSHAQQVAKLGIKPNSSHSQASAVFPRATLSPDGQVTREDSEIRWKGHLQSVLSLQKNNTGGTCPSKGLFLPSPIFLSTPANKAEKKLIFVVYICLHND